MSTVDSNEEEHLEFSLRFAIQSLPDKKIRCPVNWTVLQLKEHLYEECESKPEVNKQRLIYSGHCLKNEQILKQIFNRSAEGIVGDSDALQVVHLVCASNEQIKATKQMFNGDGLRNRHQPSSSDLSSTSTGISPAPTFEDVPRDINEAYAQAYHNYLRDYYSRASLNSGAYSLTSQTLGNSPVAVVTGVQNEPVNPPMPPQAPHAENVQPNGAEFNEHPDFLDLVYKMIRFAFLAAIILYSSFDRIIFVVAVVCIMWFVQMRRERENRNGSQNERPGNGNQEQAAANPQQANVNPENGGNNDNNNNEVLPAPQPTSAWSVFFNTIVSFFSSLIPEPVPVNIN